MSDPFIIVPGATLTFTAGDKVVAVAGVLATNYTEAGDLPVDPNGLPLASEAVAPTSITLVRPAPTSGEVSFVVAKGYQRAEGGAATAVLVRDVYRRFSVWNDSGLSVPVEAVLNAPPAFPTDGQRWIIGPSPTGAWDGKPNNIVEQSDAYGGWLYAPPPKRGDRATYNNGAGAPVELIFTGSAWRSAATLAADVAFASTGGIAATNIQDAIAELDTEKATTAALASGLAPKADTATVNAALALKADASAVATSLALKADTSTVNTALALKADTSTVNTALALKADASTVNTALALKANGADVYIKSDVDLRRVLRGRVVNGAMMVSQERGTASVDVSNGSVYTIDQWLAGAIGAGSPPGGTLRVQQVAQATPGGSPFRLRHTVQVADTSIAAGDLYRIQTLIEGRMIADALLGTASARALILRLGCRSSIAGTFGVAVLNASATRSWVGSITIAPGEVNTDVIKPVVVPGSTAGTWLTDNGIGLDVSLVLAGGSTLQGMPGWQSGAFTHPSTQSNFMATVGNTFDLFEVDLYVESLGIDTAPRWELPAIDDEIRDCQRYWFAQYHSIYSVIANNFAVQTFGFPAPMRTQPALSSSPSYTANVASFSLNALGTGGGRGVLTANASGNAEWTGTVFGNARF